MIEFLAKIRTLISYPFRLAFLALGIPNCKIVYKSGHVEYYFFKKIKIRFTGESNIAHLEWETYGTSYPVHFGVNEIESVHQLY